MKNKIINLIYLTFSLTFLGFVIVGVNLFCPYALILLIPSITLITPIIKKIVKHILYKMKSIKNEIYI